MPKIISYTPAWLSRPSIGFDLFAGQGVSDGERSRTTQAQTADDAATGDGYFGPRALIARRGTEVFVVGGNTLRWADLAMLKDDWESRAASRSSRNRRGQSPLERNDILEETKFKVLRVPIHEPIQQLVLSPNEDLLAVLTAHTVHIVILPDSSHLDQPDTGPIRVKTHTLGPTAHVLSQSRVVKALWHPLGVDGNCLVTVTADAVVRLWELNKENRWSFDSPALAMDLRKLLFASSAEDDIEAAKLGANRGYSLDGLGMEVTSATFGGTGSEDEAGWSSMTLWVAMSEGDIYALCPLLPSKWQPPATLVPSLTSSIAARKTLLEETGLTAEEERVFDSQYKWVTEIDQQEPRMVPGRNELYPDIPIYNRPDGEAYVPMLQGPFRILPGDIEDEMDLADIYVVASKIDLEELMGYDDQEPFEVPELNGLSGGIVCLLSTRGQFHVCLSLEEIGAQWLPAKKLKTEQPERVEQPELMLLETLETMESEYQDSTTRPRSMITPDIHSRYSFFISHSQGTYFLSAEPWIEALESELQNEGTAGVGFRIGVLMKSSHTLRERILRFERPDEDKARKLSAPVIFQDSDLGYFLLTSVDDRPYAALLDSPSNEFDRAISEARESSESLELPMITAAPREVYEPPDILYQPSPLSNFLDKHAQKRHRATLMDEVRLSSATLEVITEAHRILSRETHKLGVAVAEMFGRCERLKDEFRNQITRAGEVASRVDKMNDEDADDFDASDRARGRASLEQRLQRAKDKHESLVDRHERLRKKLAKTASRPLSDKEQAWVTEIGKLESSVLEPEDVETEDSSKQGHWQRFREARDLAMELIAQAKEAIEEAASDGPTNGTFRVPRDLRKTKIAQVMGLLERETALVDAAQERLEKLSLSTAT